MPAATRIATCCYCGTRAALVLRGEIRHELSCAACGAPLHMLKNLPVEAPAPVTAAKRGKPRKKKKKHKAFSRRLFKGAFDLIEDILD